MTDIALHHQPLALLLEITAQECCLVRAWVKRRDTDGRCVDVVLDKKVPQVVINACGLRDELGDKGCRAIDMMKCVALGVTSSTLDMC